MERVIEHLARAGLKDIVVSLCQAGGPIVAYFGGGQRWGVTITYVKQPEQEAGSALNWTAHTLQDTFLVLPGDSVIDFDIAAAIAFHRAHGSGATAVVKPACRRARFNPAFQSPPPLASLKRR